MENSSTYLQFKIKQFLSGKAILSIVYIYTTPPPLQTYVPKKMQKSVTVSK